MKITFVRPNMGAGKSLDAMQSLAIAVLQGLTPNGVDIDFFDDRIEVLPLDLDTDVFAMSVETFTARRAYYLASEYKKRGIYA